MKTFYKYCSVIPLCLLVVCFQVSCNRSNFSLPTPHLHSTFDTTIGTNNIRQFVLHFQKRGFAGKDSLLLSVQNLSQANYKNLQIQIEIVSEMPGNYDQVLLHEPITIPSLEGNSTSPLQLITTDTTLQLSGHLLLGIISFDGSQQPFCGDYSNIGALLQKGDTTKQHAQVQGFILDGGKAIFRIKQLGITPVYYNVSGIFTDSSYFDGTLQKYQSDTATFLQLATLTSGNVFEYDDASKKLNFRLKLSDRIADTVNHIFFSIHKN